MHRHAWALHSTPDHDVRCRNFCRCEPIVPTPWPPPWASWAGARNAFCPRLAQPRLQRFNWSLRRKPEWAKSGAACLATASWPAPWTRCSNAGPRSPASSRTAASVSPTTPPSGRCVAWLWAARPDSSPAPIAAASGLRCCTSGSPKGRHCLLDVKGGASVWASSSAGPHRAARNSAVSTDSRGR